MPWTQSDYPDAMKSLDTSVRNKAIKIANQLLKDGYEEGRAIAIAIDRAKKTKNPINFLISRLNLLASI